MTNKIPGTVEAWENRELGAEEKHVEAVQSPEMELRIDEALGLKMISMRVPERLIEDFKIIANANGGMGYQTLMKQCLKRFADSELKRMAREMAAEHQVTVRGTIAKAASSNKGAKSVLIEPPAEGTRKVA